MRDSTKLKPKQDNTIKIFKPKISKDELYIMWKKEKLPLTPNKVL